MPARSSTARSHPSRHGRFVLGGAALLLALQLAGCGNKGPLYLPDAALGSGQAPGQQIEQDEQDR